jgi:heme/copper-type cytochrome/quinol oxidase subunit 2
LFAGLLFLAASPILLAPRGDGAAASGDPSLIAPSELANRDRPDDATSPDARRLNEQAPERFVVEIIGRDFHWHFRIKEPAGFTATTNVSHSVLKLPAGVPITWELTSEDYIYVLRVPELGINMMAVPDLTSTATSERPTATEVDLLVDPLCGFRFYHDEWMGRVELTRPGQALRSP